MTQKNIKNPGDDIELLRSAAVAAGIMALGYFRRDIKSWTKENSSPVTEADFVVDDFLAKTLLGARPDYGWLSEESADDPSRLDKRRIFIVDPIDGTRGFMRGDARWSICLAVVENGVAVAGVIYAPALDELYEAVIDQGAKLNSRPLVWKPNQHPLPVIPAARAVLNELSHDHVDYIEGPTLPSLAHRLVQVATGTLDVAIGRRGAQDWDIAAASVILKECGIGFEDVCVGAPKFNKPEIRHGALAAIRDNSLREAIHDSLKRVYGCPDDIKQNPSGEKT